MPLLFAFKGWAGGAGDQDAPVGDAPPRRPRRRPASKLPRIEPTTRYRVGLATRSGAGVSGPRGGTCGPVASGASRSRTRAAPVLRRDPPRPHPRTRAATGRRPETPGTRAERPETTQHRAAAKTPRRRRRARCGRRCPLETRHRQRGKPPTSRARREPDDHEGPRSYGTRACLVDDGGLCGDAGSGDRGDPGTGESTGTPAGVGTRMCGDGEDVTPASHKGCSEGTGLAAGDGAGEPGTEAEPTDVDEPLEDRYTKTDGSPIDVGEEAPDPAAGDDEGRTEGAA
ncbi:hypothetical protein MRX96_029940 [Rhipicephalus microplus]